jgi:ABC-type antimicrobial peptide transport system permease subunit
VLALSGAAIGAAVAMAVTRYLSGLLYGISPTDVPFAVLTLLIIGVTLLANYVPAYRASKVDPLVALRYE